MNSSAITILVDDFDFEKVHRYMLHTDWKWQDGAADKSSVPNISRLKKCAVDLLETVSRPECDYCSTGGFVARKETGETGLYLSLAFQIASGTEEI